MIRIMRYSEAGTEVFNRNTPEVDVRDQVAAIIKRVREEGDRALFDYTKAFDNVVLSQIEVGSKEVAGAREAVGEEFLFVLERAAANIRVFHEKQRRSGYEMRSEDGRILGQRILPLERVGLYIPGGTAAYPSSVLMNAIPAQIAGVKEIIMVSPPTGGSIKAEILAAASVAGVDRIFSIGGAQAVAALAYGTKSVPQVDKIVGPGNIFVAEAKRQVFGRVAIDMIAGPSEILIIADRFANARWLAADMLSQAEHDKDASAVLVTDSEALALRVAEEIEIQLSGLEREAIARSSIEENGRIILVDTIEEAISISNRIAPEHLEIVTEDAPALLDKIRHAGSIFLGSYCPEALGDYFAGPNHTLPTGGSARFSSPLSVDDFVKSMQYSQFSKNAFLAIADDVIAFAEREGLFGHAESVRVRLEDLEERGGDI